MDKAVKRLLNDLKELDKTPVVNANARPIKDNMMIWHANVLITTGPYAGVIVHFVLEFPPDYPVSPPSAYFITPIVYYGGAVIKDAKGRYSVCLDLFGNFAHVHTEWKSDGVASGWSSSYSVMSILLQMQAAILGGEYLSTAAKDVLNTKSFKFVCDECSHDSSDVDKYWPPVSDKLCEHKHESIHNEIICYVNKQTFDDANNEIFGYGVTVNFNGSLSSPAEYLSKDAFDSGIRRGSMNQNFSHFLPLYITEKHWKNSKNIFEKAINSIYADMKKPGVAFEQKVFCVLASIMNSTVVEVMNQKNQLSANDKFINGYFNCYRILHQITKEYPNLVNFANMEIQKFLEKSQNRTKDKVPNLGDWLILLSICSKFSWMHVAKDFIEEADARNVFWYVQGSRNQPGKHPELADVKIVNNRTKKTFEATETSRNLICFQTRFLSKIPSLDIQKFDDNFGSVSEDVKNELKNMYNEIVKIKNWNEYFKWNGMDEQSEDERLSQLIAAVKISETNGYHGARNNNNNRNNNRNNSQNYRKKY